MNATIISGLRLLGEQIAAATPRWCRDAARHARQLAADDDGVQREVDRDERDGEPDGFAKALQKDQRRARRAAPASPDRMIEPVRHERVLDDVRGGVRGRERDGDDEVRGRESEQAQDERLAAPSRQVLLEHREAALPVRAERARCGCRPAARRRA